MPFEAGYKICKRREKTRFKIAVFDFDGTVSWLRHGWPGLMCRIFTSYYQPMPGETPEGVQNTLMDEILSLNGKPTIHQMRTFHERMKRRGTACPTPEELLEQYHSGLYAAIAERRKSTLDGKAEPDEFLVCGVRQVLESLKAREIKMYVLSGTVQPQVRAEADLLGVSKYFEGRIFGSPETPGDFTKLAMIRKFIEESGISGREVLAFGDGPIEIENVDSLGGTAVGVASNEEVNGSGEADLRKASQLEEAGAAAIMADYQEADELLKELCE